MWLCTTTKCCLERPSTPTRKRCSAKSVFSSNGSVESVPFDEDHSEDEISETGIRPESELEVPMQGIYVRTPQSPVGVSRSPPVLERRVLFQYPSNPQVASARTGAEVVKQAQAPTDTQNKENKEGQASVQQPSLAAHPSSPSEPRSLFSTDTKGVSLAQSIDFNSWSIDAVCDWLMTKPGLPADIYANFRKEAINGRVLISLTDNDLRDLGVSQMGARQMLLRSIRDLQQQRSHARDRSSSATPLCVKHEGRTSTSPSSPTAKTRPGRLGNGTEVINRSLLQRVDTMPKLNSRF